MRSHHGAQFLGQSLAPVHVGLGEATAVDRVVVRWPGGGEDVATGLATDQPIRIRQGVGLVEGQTVAAGAPPEAPSGLRVLAVSPNPSAAGSVEVRVASPAPTLLGVDVLDRLGRRLRHFQASVASGASGVVWDGLDASGRRVPPGLYLLSLSSPGQPLATARVVISR